MTNMYDIETMKKWSKEDMFNFIRTSLRFDIDCSQLRYIDSEEFKREHKRFKMSGYETENGNCTIHNQKILNTFAWLGIYNYTEYLFLDFYKGIPTLYLKYWGDDKNLEFKFDDLGTVEIIYEIFKLTILNNNLSTRRRI